MTDEHVSDRQQLVQQRFDAKNAGPVGAWIEARRADGMSWAGISFALRDLAGIEVSYETLRRWASQRAEGAEPSGAGPE